MTSEVWPSFSVSDLAGVPWRQGMSPNEKKLKIALKQECCDLRSSAIKHRILLTFNTKPLFHRLSDEEQIDQCREQAHHDLHSILLLDCLSIWERHDCAAAPDAIELGTTSETRSNLGRVQCVKLCTSLSWKIIKLNIIKSSEQCTEFLTNLNRETNRPQGQSSTTVTHCVLCAMLSSPSSQNLTTEPQHFWEFLRMSVSIHCLLPTNPCWRYVPLYTLTWRLYRLNLKSLSAQFCQIIVQQRYTPNRVLTFGCPHLKCIGKWAMFHSWIDSLYHRVYLYVCVISHNCLSYIKYETDSILSNPFWSLANFAGS